MDPPLPSFTSIWHNEPYEAVSPSRPELSAAGKTVIITGAVCGFYPIRLPISWGMNKLFNLNTLLTPAREVE